MSALVYSDRPRRDLAQGYAEPANVAQFATSAATRAGRKSVTVSGRLGQQLADYDVRGEQAMAMAQAIMAFFLLSMHDITAATQNPWVVLTLVSLIATSAVRFVFAAPQRLPTAALDALNLSDVALFLLLIWTQSTGLGKPLGSLLTAQSFTLLVAVVSLRVLKSHPRPLLIAGSTAIFGWIALVVIATSGPYGLPFTRELFQTQIEMMFSLVATVAALWIAVDRASQLVGRAADASDYADALAAAQRSLEDARRAQTRAEAALNALDARDEQLGEQNRLFDALLSNISQGICMYDSQQRLLACNDRYREMYALPPEWGIRGVSFRDVVTHHVSVGIYAGNDPQKYLAERLADVTCKEHTTQVKELVDGRFITISHRPLVGGGWVATHDDITELHRIEARLDYVARHDSLTNLPNRAQLLEVMQDILYGELREGQSLVLLLTNLDRFKEINDTLGHEHGDSLLQEFAARLGTRLTQARLIARTGGDEFAMLIVANDAAKAAIAVAETLRDILAEPFDLAGMPVVVTTSSGIAVGPREASEPAQLMKNADLALDRAKDSGFGAYCFFEPELDAGLSSRRELERDLRLAIDHGEFDLDYQPQLDLASDRIVGCEALLRWRHPMRGRISPLEFIPVAEATKLIVPIGAWVLETACREATRWPAHMTVAVNLSVIQLRAGGVYELVVEALRKSGLEARRLELEVTESILMDENRDIVIALERLRGLGVRIALDDFGTGYSSLGYLRRVSFDKIKIDRSFVGALSGHEDNALAIVRTVAALGSSLGIATTAEGVETAEQLDLLRREGFTHVQGYLISRPVPPAEIRRLVGPG